jgi:hypothetical protein
MQELAPAVHEEGDLLAVVQAARQRRHRARGVVQIGAIDGLPGFGHFATKIDRTSQNDKG